MREDRQPSAECLDRYWTPRPNRGSPQRCRIGLQSRAPGAEARQLPLPAREASSSTIALDVSSSLRSKAIWVGRGPRPIRSQRRLAPALGISPCTTCSRPREPRKMRLEELRLWLGSALVAHPSARSSSALRRAARSVSRGRAASGSVVRTASGSFSRPRCFRPCRAIVSAVS